MHIPTHAHANACAHQYIGIHDTYYARTHALSHTTHVHRLLILFLSLIPLRLVDGCDQPALQSAFDLLAELVRFCAPVFARLNQILDGHDFAELIRIMTRNLVMRAC